MGETKRTLTDRLWEKTDAAGFYSRFARLTRAGEGGELKGLCPLHEERHPSFHVNPETGSFHCFGCGAGGGPLQFYAALFQLGEFEAAARLRSDFGLDGAEAGAGGTAVRAPADPTRPARARGDGGSTRRTSARSNGGRGGSSGAPPPPDADSVEVYRALLDLGRPLPETVLEYFDGRRIRPETLERFGVSFLADPSAAAESLRERFSEERLTASGVFRRSESGPPIFQFLHHPLLFPILSDGEPVFVQGRLFGRGPQRPKYCNLSGVAVPTLFNADTLRDAAPNSPVFLCEGAPDAMILAQEGFSAVGVVGSGGFKLKWVDLLAPFRVFLAFDRDDAGRRGRERIAALLAERGIPCASVELPESCKDVNDFFLDGGAEDFQRLAAQAETKETDFPALVCRMLARVADRRDPFSYPALAEEIYRWFERRGAVFVVDAERRGFMIFDHRDYEIGNNSDFNALIYAKTNLVLVEHHGRMVWQILKNLCVLRGISKGNLRWIHSDLERARVWVNLHNPTRQIARLTPGRAEVLPNGGNEDAVMLGAADKMEGWDFDPSANPREAVGELSELVVDALACEPENRLLAVCWILTAFFLDFTSEKALLKLSGHTSSGKTTAARLLSCLLYGADHVETATVAYYYADAAQNPFLICDNLETENLNPRIVDFLLHVATGIEKGKRKAGSDSGTVRESAKALVAITSIDPLTKPELINRTLDVEFRSLFQSGGFMQREHLERLVRARGRILSGLFALFAREVLPGLRGAREEILATLRQRHPRHPKHRVDAFLSLMIAILRALLKTQGEESRVWPVADAWIRYQARMASETEQDTNAGLYLLEALVKEAEARDGDFRREYYLDVERTTNELGKPLEVSFTASARDLLIAFQILSKQKGYRLPFSNSRQLGVRLANESEVLQQAGWSWQRTKVVNGTRYHRYTKRMG
jgi:hypothetical protein